MKKLILSYLLLLPLLVGCEPTTVKNEVNKSQEQGEVQKSSLTFSSTTASPQNTSRLKFNERMEYDCPQVAALVNTGNSVLDALQACIDNAPLEGKILLPGGRYVLHKNLDIRRSVTIGTKGLSPSDSSCENTDSSRCATFILSVALNASLPAGIIQINADKVEIDHIVVDGDRNNPIRQIQSLCRNGTRGQAYNFIVNGTDFKISNSVIRNAPCGTGMEVRGSASRLIFINNFVGPNGIHNEDQMWADGLTVHDNADAIVESNTFYNNTDVDLIFGGCQRCSISKNQIIHDSSFSGSTFAGLMLHSWDPQHGNYTGSVTQLNTVECSYMKRCGFGILLGARPWYDQPYFGGIVADNKVNNAMAGLVVDGATGATTLENNTVTNSGGKYLASCGEREFDSYSISSASLPYVKTNQVAPSNKSFAGCVANWWSKDSVPPRCDGAQYVYPHYGIKNGACLPSCGVLGGTKTPASSCAQNGLRDMGQAYDVPYCCGGPCDPKIQPSPHYGAKNGQCLPSCGVLGGTLAPKTSCASVGMRDVGTSYDVPYCCAPLCDPKTQPSPHFGVKNGQCRPSCGALGGTKAPTKACASVGLTDVGVAYDVPYCCK